MQMKTSRKTHTWTPNHTFNQSSKHRKTKSKIDLLIVLTKCQNTENTGKTRSSIGDPFQTEKQKTKEKTESNRPRESRKSGARTGQRPTQF